MNTYYDIELRELRDFDKTKRLSQSDQEKIRNILRLVDNLDNLNPDDMDVIRQMSLKGYNVIPKDRPLR